MDARILAAVVVILLVVIGVLGYQVWQLSESRGGGTAPSVITNSADLKKSIDNITTQLQDMAAALKGISDVI